jgi:hypothetical protein
LLALFLLSTLWLTACGELEFGVETKVSSGRPEVTVVTTTMAEIPEGMVLVTVTPSAQATALDAVTVTPTAVATETPEAAETAVAAAVATATKAHTPTPRFVPPTSTPTVTPSEAVILGYVPVRRRLSPGDSVTLDYLAVGEFASLCLSPAGAAQWDCRSVPVSGPYTLTIDPTYRTNLDVELHVYAGETEALAFDFITLFCPEDAWFFSGPPTTCPAGAPIETNAAFQPFEHGWMLWLQEDDTIYTFYEEPDPTFASYPEYTLPGDDAPVPSDEYDPPEGLFVPISGFGRLWREYSWVRQKLGWALAPEEGFTTTIQREIQQDASYLYLIDPEGQVVVLNLYRATWAERDQP